MERQTYVGSCHCRKIRFEVTTEMARTSQCNCSICIKKGYLHHMVTAEDFRLLSGADDLSTYRFGTMTAQHHFCKHCGVAPFIRPRSYPANYIVNVRCLEGLDPGSLATEQFDGRSWELKPGAGYTGPWSRRY